MNLTSKKIAIVHDWLMSIGGGEKVLLHLLDCFPNSDLFCVVESLSEKDRKQFPEKIQTTFISKAPFVKKMYWYYAGLMPIAIEQIDLSEYDIVLSSSHSFAKGVISHPEQLHISYMHSPIRYAWDLQFYYFKSFKYEKGIKRILASLVFYYIRNWDARSTNGVDFIIANSNFIQKRIEKCYRRNSDLIYPGIDTEMFSFEPSKEPYYLAGSFMNPFKKIDLIVQAFCKMPNKKLKVFGSGPQLKHLKSIATPNIQFLGRVSDDHLVKLMQKASAFVFSAIEDFGMIMAEAQSCGTPVIALRKGGAKEIIIDINNNPNTPTGVFFNKADNQSIINAVNDFHQNKEQYSPMDCHNNAQRFSSTVFKKKIKNYVNEKWKEWDKL